jgi:large subunit ribosomal protein L29
MLTASDVRSMSDPEIQARIEELHEELFRLRFRGSMMQLENPHLPRQLRRESARMKTVLRELELAATEAGESA